MPVPPVAGNPTYYIENLLGTSRVLTSSTGVPCYDADFYPYGGERPYLNTCPQNYKFEGKERDSETGNDDFGARYYTYRFGRWLSADWSAVPAPIPYANLTNPQTLNLYSMVADDPESFADLDGHAFSQMYQIANPSAIWDPSGATSMTDDSGLTQDEFNLMQAAQASSQSPQNQPQAQNQSSMSISQQGLAFIEKREGYSDKLYKDVAGNDTIGYGHLVQKGEDFSKGITKDKAEHLLAQDIKAAESIVNRNITKKVSQSQFDALTDFVYNLGGKNFGKSKLLSNLNSENAVTRKNFTDWNKAGGKASRGLTARRNNEFRLFSTGEY